MALEQFVNLYSLSKTLRFELIPQGKTLEHIKVKGLLVQDEQRAENYKKVKKIIDEYHKDFIEKALSGIKLTKLNDFHSQYQLPKERGYVSYLGVIQKLRKYTYGNIHKNIIPKRLYLLPSLNLFSSTIQQY